MSKKMKSKSNKIRKLKGPLLNVAKSMGKWRPQDDFMLIQSILHLSDIKDVHSMVNFTSKFTQKEIEERWYAFMYDEQISKMIRKNIKKLNVDDLSRLEKQIPFNDNETFILMGLDSKSDRDENFFEDILFKQRPHFHQSRTAKCLQKKFNMLKKLSLLKDQVLEDNQEIEFKINEIESFDKIMNRLDDEKIDSQIQVDPKLEQDMNETYETLVDNIRKAEADVFLWQGLIDKINGDTNPFEQPDCLAVIFNENFTHTMTKRDISFGRSRSADVDLSPYEFFSKKMSRNQFKISCLDSNLFMLCNFGKLVVYVDGKVVSMNKKTQVFDKSIIEIGDISMLFLVNYNNVTDNKLNADQLIDKLK